MGRIAMEPREAAFKTIDSGVSRSALSVVEQEFSWREAFRRAGGPWSDEERQYVQTVLDRYLWLHVTPVRIGRDDRRCARALYARRVPLERVEGALLLATARRTFRSAAADTLSPIRGLRYFLPAVEELMATDLAPGYVEYLIAKLRPFAEAKRRPVNMG